MKRYIALISVVWLLLNTLPAIGFSVIADIGDNAEAKTELRYEDTLREGLARPKKAIDVGAESFSSQKSDAVLETLKGKQWLISLKTAVLFGVEGAAYSI